MGDVDRDGDIEAVALNGEPDRAGGGDLTIEVDRLGLVGVQDERSRDQVLDVIMLDQGSVPDQPSHA